MLRLAASGRRARGGRCRAPVGSARGVGAGQAPRIRQRCRSGGRHFVASIDEASLYTASDAGPLDIADYIRERSPNASLRVRAAILRFALQDLRTVPRGRSASDNRRRAQVRNQEIFLLDLLCFRPKCRSRSLFSLSSMSARAHESHEDASQSDALSAAVAIDAFEGDQRILHEGRRQVVLDHLGERLEHLEMMPARRRSRTPRGSRSAGSRAPAGHLRDHHGLVVGKREARARPVAHAIERGASGAGLLEKPSMAPSSYA